MFWRTSYVPWLSCSSSRARKSVVYSGFAFSLRIARNSFRPEAKLCRSHSTSADSASRLMP
jgi:hypothetical protein